MMEAATHPEQVADAQVHVVGVEQAVAGMGPRAEVPRTVATGVPLGVHDHVGPRPQWRPGHEVSDEQLHGAVDQGLAQVHGEGNGVAGAQPGLVARASEGAAQIPSQEAERRKGHPAAPCVLEGGSGIGVAVHHHSPVGQRTTMTPALPLLDRHVLMVTS